MSPYKPPVHLPRKALEHLISATKCVIESQWVLHRNSPDEPPPSQELLDKYELYKKALAYVIEREKGG